MLLDCNLALSNKLGSYLDLIVVDPRQYFIKRKL